MQKRQQDTRLGDFGTKFEDGPTGLKSNNEGPNRNKAVYGSKKIEAEPDYEEILLEKEYQPEDFEENEDEYDYKFIEAL